MDNDKNNRIYYTCISIPDIIVAFPQRYVIGDTYFTIGDQGYIYREFGDGGYQLVDNTDRLDEHFKFKKNMPLIKAFKSL